MDASEHAPSGGSPGALLQFKERRKTADETRPQRGLRCATGGNEADGYSTAGAVTLTSINGAVTLGGKLLASSPKGGGGSVSVAGIGVTTTADKGSMLAANGPDGTVTVLSLDHDGTVTGDVSEREDLGPIVDQGNPGGHQRPEVPRQRVRGGSQEDPTNHDTGARRHTQCLPIARFIAGMAGHASVIAAGNWKPARLAKKGRRRSQREEGCMSARAE